MVGVDWIELVTNLRSIIWARACSPTVRASHLRSGGYGLNSLSLRNFSEFMSLCSMRTWYLYRPKSHILYVDCLVGNQMKISYLAPLGYCCMYKQSGNWSTQCHVWCHGSFLHDEPWFEIRQDTRCCIKLSTNPISPSVPSNTIVQSTKKVMYVCLTFWKQIINI